MRDLLPLLRRNPTLYHKAVQQVVPAMSFDYLKINPIGVGAQPYAHVAVTFSLVLGVGGICWTPLLPERPSP